jgi:hypothetical protein
MATDSRSTPAPLADALDKNKRAAEEVKEAADELAVVHAVLDTKLPEDAKAHEVAHAVAQASELEKRLTETGKALDEVNKTLERESGGAKP